MAVKEWEIEFELVLPSEEELAADRSLAARVWNEIHSSTSSKTLAEREIARESPDNQVGGRKRRGHYFAKGHRGGGRSVNRGSALRSFFKMSDKQRSRHY